MSRTPGEGPNEWGPAGRPLPPQQSQPPYGPYPSPGPSPYPSPGPSPYPSPGPSPVQPLGYAGPGSGGPPAPRGSMAGRVLLGFIGYVGLSLTWVFGSAFAFKDAGIVFGGWAVMTVALLGLALFVRLRYRVAGFGYGILVALGVGLLCVIGLVLLVIGLCNGSFK